MDFAAAALVALFVLTRRSSSPSSAPAGTTAPASSSPPSSTADDLVKQGAALAVDVVGLATSGGAPAAGTATAAGAIKGAVSAASSGAATAQGGATAAETASNVIAMSDAAGAALVVGIPLAAWLACKIISEIQTAGKEWQQRWRWASTVNPRDVTRIEADLARQVLASSSSSGAAGVRGSRGSGIVETTIDDPRCSQPIGISGYQAIGSRQVFTRPAAGYFADPANWSELELVCRVLAVEYCLARSARAHAFYVYRLGLTPLADNGQDFATLDQVPGLGGNVIDGATRERAAAFMRSSSCPALMAHQRYLGVRAALDLVQFDPGFYPVWDPIAYTRDTAQAMWPSGFEGSGVALDGEWLDFDGPTWALPASLGVSVPRLKNKVTPAEVAL